MPMYEGYNVTASDREGRRVDMVKAGKLTQAIEIILNHLNVLRLGEGCLT